MSGLTFDELGAQEATSGRLPTVQIESIYVNNNLTVTVTYSIFLIDSLREALPITQYPWESSLRFYTLGIFNKTNSLRIKSGLEETVADETSIRLQRLQAGSFQMGEITDDGTKYRGIFDYFENLAERTRVSWTNRPADSDSSVPYYSPFGIHAAARYGLGIPTVDPDSSLYGECQNYLELV